GELDIQPDHWECRNFRGTHKGGEIRVNAGSYRVNAVEPVAAHGDEVAPPESRPQQRECVQVDIIGRGILLDSEFEEALSPREVPGRAALQNAWAMLALKGRLSFEAAVEDRPDKPQGIDVTVRVNGCSMQPEFFRYAMTDVSARVRYTQGRVDVKDVSAKHGPSQLGLKEATILLKQPGGFQAWFKGIHGTRLVPDEEFLRALPPMMRRGLEPLQIRKPIDVETVLILDSPSAAGQPMKFWWDGGARLHDQLFQAGVEISGVEGTIWCHGHHNGQQFEGVSGYAVLERASILGQPFTNLQGRIEIVPETPDILRLYDLKANLFGGFAGGEARFVFGPTLHYDVKLDALHVQLEQFGKHNKLGTDAQLQGPARASLYLTGDGTDLSGLKGNGRIEVANGKLYRLPLLLDLLKAFALCPPDRTAFEQARMIFAIEGPTMRVHGLDLYGNAISLRGQGTARLDGSNLNLDFSADWGRVPQMLPTPISDLSQALSDQIFKIKVRGKISAPQFQKELVPGVVDPIKKALGRS
ncbi:MAG TPA: AsmA-like C-terminal region-containing protein, partial [Gemmataceae bacterium]